MCTRWGRIFVRHLWRLTPAGSKREVHTAPPPPQGSSKNLSQIMPLHHSGSYSRLQSDTRPAPTLEPLLHLTSFTVSLAHCTPDTLVSQLFLRLLKHILILETLPLLFVCLESVLQLSTSFLPSLLSLRSNVREGCHYHPTQNSNLHHPTTMTELCPIHIHMLNP